MLIVSIILWGSIVSIVRRVIMVMLFMDFVGFVCVFILIGLLLVVW